MDSHWTVTSEPFRRDGYTWVECLCECGTQRNVRLHALKAKRPSKSCGCLRREVTRDNFTTHGQCKTHLYKIWAGMRKRCNDSNSIGWHNYGGRGIRVCKAWDTFQAFSTWSLQNGYKPHLTIDRINGNLGYSPSNCWFATRKQQSENRRNWGLSKYKGVSFDQRSKRWYAYVGNGKSRKKLGTFKSELAAYRSRNNYLRLVTK